MAFQKAAHLSNRVLQLPQNCENTKADYHAQNLIIVNGFMRSIMILMESWGTVK